MNRLYLTLKYPEWRLWAEHFIYFYNEFGVVCILDSRTDTIVNEYYYREVLNLMDKR